MAKINYYCLGYAPHTKILTGLIFTDRKQAAERAKQENKCGQYRGRGIKVYKCDQYGNITA